MHPRIIGIMAAGFLGASGVLFGLAPRGEAPRADGLVSPGPIDLGVVDQGETRSFAFEVKNPTATPAMVIDLTSSCGCTWLSDAKGSTIAAGQSLAIRGTLDTKGRRGPMGSHAFLRYQTQDGVPERNLILTVSAVVRPKLRVEPESIDVDLADGATKEIVRTVAVDSDQIADFSLFDANSSAGWIDVEIVEKKFAAGRPASVRITIDPAGRLPVPGDSAESVETVRFRTSVEVDPYIEIPIRIRKP